MDNLKITWLLFFSILTFSPCVSSAQGDTPSASGKNEIATPTEDVPSHSLFAGMGYGSNMIYMGSNVSQDKPYYSGSLTYGYKNMFFATVSTNHLSAFDPFIDFSTFSLSYNHNLKKWLDISLGISRYQVNNELSDTLFSNFNYGYLSLGFDWKILYTSISAGGILSDASTSYFNLRNSRYIQTPKLFNAKGYFYFDPYINLLFGKLTKTTTSEGTSIGVTPPFTPGRSSGGGTGSGSGGGSSSSTITTSAFFSLMEADFGLPAGLSIGKFTIEAEPGYVLPTYSNTDVLYPKGFTFLLNLYIQIF